MAITWDDVTAIAPELAIEGVVSETTQDAIVAHTLALLNETSWGDRYDMACAYYAAHVATVTVRGGNGAAGNVVSESIGDVSRTYAVFSPAGSDPLLDTTPYGKHFRYLKKTLLSARMLVT